MKLQLHSKKHFFKKLTQVFVLVGCITVAAQTQIGQDIDGNTTEERLGAAVSVSADGTIIATGANTASGGGNFRGAVRVFENQNDSWVQIGQDINGDANSDFFGSTASLSDDGTILAIGATRNDSNGQDSGHVRVFEYQAGSWVQIGQDIEGTNAGDRAAEVTLSGDGTTLAIGSGNHAQMGQVRIFENQGGNWVQIGTDLLGDETNEFFGGSVSLSQDGSILAVGAGGSNNGGEQSGQVQIYENQNGTWVQLGQDINGVANFDFFGYSVSLSNDGSIVAAGAPAHNGVNGLDSGHVRIFQNQNGTWEQVGDDIDGEAAIDNSGGTVSLSADGSIIAIGAIGNLGDTRSQANSRGFESRGHVRIYQNQNGTWVQIGEDIDGEGEEDSSSVSLSISSDGLTVAIGAIGNSDNGILSGHVRVFSLEEVLSTEEILPAIGLSLYPNPTHNNFKVSLLDVGVIESIAMYNTLGQKVLVTKESDVDVSSLVSGIYIVQVKTSAGITSSKLIIDK